MFDIRVLDTRRASRLVVVTATSFDSSLSEIREAESQLLALGRDCSCDCFVIDLLCTNGFEWNRFLCVPLSDSGIKLHSAKIIDEHELEPTVLASQVQLFRENPQFLRNSILSEQEQSMLLS